MDGNDLSVFLNFSVCPSPPVLPCAEVVPFHYRNGLLKDPHWRRQSKFASELFQLLAKSRKGTRIFIINLTSL